MSDLVRAARPTEQRSDTRALIVVALLALVVSAPTLANGFAYDDRWIIVTNTRVHSLARWADWFRTPYWPTLEGSLYRPLTTAGFAVQWAVGDGAPWVFHVVNVALYVAGAAAFAWLASLCLPATPALIAAALFAVHPVHVEAVANAVGQSELSAGLVLIVATATYIRARRRGELTRRMRLALAMAYLVAIFLKEHAIVLPGILVAAEFTLLRDSGPLRDRIRALAPAFTLLAVMAVVALVARWDAIDALAGDIPHPALQGLGTGERAFMMLGIIPELVRLLVWPARLFADYSPQFVTVSPTPDVSQLNGAAILVGVVVLATVAWRLSRAAAFGIACFAVMWLPTANVVFPSGVLLAERTLYMPSMGFVLALGALLAWLDARTRMARGARFALAGALALILTAGIMRSVTRARVWRSSEDVFAAMIRDQPLSFKAHHAWGGVLFERGDLVGGEREWRMAMRLFPSYHKVYEDLAAAYLTRNLCAPAIPLFETAIRLGGTRPRARAGITACQLDLARFSDARRTARLGILDGNDPAWFRARLFSADSALTAHDSIPR